MSLIDRGRELRAKLANNPGYARALLSSYGLVATNVLVQLMLVPLYLDTLDKYRFGILMILLAFFGYAALGMAFMTGGMARILGEFHAREDRDGFRRGYLLSKLTYVGYAAMIGVLALGAVILFEGTLFEFRADYRETVLWTVAAGGLYFVLHYEFSVDRLALAATGRQGTANLLTIVTLVGFVVLVVPWLLGGGDLPGVLFPTSSIETPTHGWRQTSSAALTSVCKKSTGLRAITSSCPRKRWIGSCGSTRETRLCLEES